MFYIGDKKVLKDFDDLEILGDGNESVVRKYDDCALKVYRTFCRKDRIDEETVNYLKQIYTSRIVLPNECLYSNNHDFVGYVSKYLDSIPLDFIENLSISKFIDELRSLREDVLKLSTNNIDIDDLNRNNIVYDGNINIIDVGSFKVSDCDFILLKDSNMEKINDFMINDVIMPIAYKQSFGKKSSRFLDKMLSSDYDKIEEFVMESSNSTENVNKYVKRMLSSK